jgi:hypothetical protein
MFCYFGSYAPIYRFSNAYPHRTPEAAHGGWNRLYLPVDWIIDNTWIRAPLFAWAGIWGVGDRFATAHDLRMAGDIPVNYWGPGDRMGNDPELYPEVQH